MTVAITCPTCGKYVRKKTYRKHLRAEHGIGTDDPNAPPAMPSQDGNTKPGRHSRTPAPVRYPSGAYANTPTPGQRVSHRVRACLELSKKHRDALDQIFIAPEFCLYLLLTHHPTIKTRSDAQLFLLRHKREIDGYLPSHNRSALIDLLSGFMLEWSTQVPDQIGLQFDVQIVTDDGASFARIRGVGDVLLNDRSVSGTLPRSLLEFSVTIAKVQESYSLDFVYDDTEPEPVSTAARIWKSPSDQDTHRVMPAPQLRADAKRSQRK